MQVNEEEPEAKTERPVKRVKNVVDAKVDTCESAIEKAGIPAVKIGRFYTKRDLFRKLKEQGIEVINFKE